MKKFTFLKSLLVVMALSLFSFSAVAEEVWTLVTDASALAVGDQVVVVAKEANFAMSTTQNSNNRAQAAVTKTGNTITFGSDVQVLTLENGTKSGTFAFNTGSGYLYAASSSKNYLKTETELSDNSSWKIEIATTGVATIKAQGGNTRNWMRYNKSNTPPLFACYGSGQTDVCIYKKMLVEASAVATPSFSEVGGDKFVAFDLTITCETEGAEIYYILNGGAETKYTGAINIATTTELKVWAVKGEDKSAEVSVAYTFPIDVANIAAWKETSVTNKTTNVRITGAVVVTYSNAGNTYIQDESGYLNVYSYDFDDLVKSGSVITNLVGKHGEYNGAIQVVYTSAATPTIVAGEAVAPIEITLDDVNAENLYKYVTLKNVEIKSDVTFNKEKGVSGYLVNGEKDVTIYSQFKNFEASFKAGDKVDVIGVIGTYKGNAQLLIAEIEISKTIVPVAPVAPVITIDATTATATITCETEGAIIKYAVLPVGEEVAAEKYQTYETAFALNKDANSYTIYAYAENAGLKSDVVTAKYAVKDGQVTVGAEVIAISNIFVQNGTIVAEGEFQIFTVTGQNVTDMNGNLQNGIYVVKSANSVCKVIVK